MDNDETGAAELRDQEVVEILRTLDHHVESIRIVMLFGIIVAILIASLIITGTLDVSVKVSNG